MISEPIKKIIGSYIDNLEPSDLEVGKVLSTSPLVVQIPDFPEPLSSEFLLVPKRLIEDNYEIEISGLSLTHSLVDEGTVVHSGEANATIKLKGSKLTAGDTVALLKAKGGQKYLILDKVVTV